MHHSKIDEARPGDNVGINMKGLVKTNMPHTGDVMIFTKDSTLRAAGTFTAQVQILDIPGEIKVNYSPTVFVRTGHSACKISRINWKMGKETAGKKVENPEEGEQTVKALKSNEMAEIVFKPIQPLVVDVFTNCEVSFAFDLFMFLMAVDFLFSLRFPMCAICFLFLFSFFCRVSAESFGSGEFRSQGAASSPLPPGEIGGIDCFLSQNGRGC